MASARCAIFLLLLTVPHLAFADAEPTPDATRSVILLVQGIVIDERKPLEVWGRRAAPGQWSGMIGFLESSELIFGGIIRPESGRQIALPGDLERSSIRVASDRADFFAIEFSAVSRVEGLAAKADELASCISAIRTHCGCQCVTLVAHSAGGLIARLYIQNGLASTPFRHDVDRLITIGTPHLGSVFAKAFGPFLGEHVQSLRYDHPRIHKLATADALPPDVRFASIVVSAIGFDMQDVGQPYQPMTAQVVTNSLPSLFRCGGDGIVHSISQNLRLAACAAESETTGGLPVQYCIVRIRADDRETAHTSALSNSNVHRWVKMFLAADPACWTGRWMGGDLGEWVDRQATECAADLVHDVLAKHRFGQTAQAQTLFVGFVRRTDTDWVYRFRAEAQFSVVAVQNATVSGRLVIRPDRYGRILGSSAEILEAAEQSPMKESSVHEMLNRANQNLIRDEYGLALAGFRRVLLQDKQDSHAKDGLYLAYIRQAGAYLSRDDLSKAEDCYDGAIAANDQEALGYIARAIVRLRLMKMAEAQHDYECALARHPTGLAVERLQHYRNIAKVGPNSH